MQDMLCSTFDKFRKQSINLSILLAPVCWQLITLLSEFGDGILCLILHYGHWSPQPLLAKCWYCLIPHCGTAGKILLLSDLLLIMSILFVQKKTSVAVVLVVEQYLLFIITKVTQPVCFMIIMKNFMQVVSRSDHWVSTLIREVAFCQYAAKQTCGLVEMKQFFALFKAGKINYHKI